MAAYRVVNDLVFKAIFGSSQDTKLLINLLNAILENNNEEQIKELEILNPFSLQSFELDKKVILDIKAKDRNEKVVNIEVQLNTTDVFRKRIVYYNSKTIADELVSGNQYEELPKVITIAIIANTVLLQEETAVQNVYKLKNTKSGKELTDLTEIHIVELQKFDESRPYSIMTRFEKWLNYLKKGEEMPEWSEEKRKEIEQDEEIKMAIEAYQRVTSSKEMQWAIEAREKAIRDEYALLKDAEQRGEIKGEIKGKIEGEIEGIIKGKIEAGISAYNYTRDIELSSKIAGLSVEELQKYIEKGDNKLVTDN